MKTFTRTRDLTSGRKPSRTGESRTRLYKVWDMMLGRCYRPKTDRYSQYGGRGITVCEEWLDFEVFKEWALGHGYSDTMTIERLDVGGSYSPENCIWLSAKLQQRNTQKTLWVEAWGETKSLAEWIEDPRCVVKYHTAYRRLRHGASGEEALGQEVPQ